MRRELAFMATETLLMRATKRGGDRQKLHELIRKHSMVAHAAIERGEENPLVELLLADPAFDLSREEVDASLQPNLFTGRAAEQVEEFLGEVATPALERIQAAAIEEPKV